MMHWEIEVHRPTWIDFDAVWAQVLAIGGIESYTFAPLDALPQSGDRITTHGLLFEFEVVGVDEHCGRFVRHQHSSNNQPRNGYWTQGFHIRHYQMHRIPRRRDFITANAVRAWHNARAWWYGLATPAVPDFE